MSVMGKIRSVESELRWIFDDNDIAVPKTAIVLGSGLGDVADAVESSLIIPYAELANFPVSTAPGHKGRFVVGNLGDTPVIVMQGRVHYYEGYPMTDVVLPLRALARLGVENFVLTNAAGGMQDGMQVGDFTLICDHVSSFVPSPLIGPNLDELGLRFSDMTQVYDLDLQATVKKAAETTSQKLLTGIYCQLTGPHFETPFEIQMLKNLGIDLVGMSTVVEAIALRHMDKRVVGISMVSNLAAGLSDELLCGSDVIDAGEKVGPMMTALLTEAIKNF